MSLDIINVPSLFRDMYRVNEIPAKIIAGGCSFRNQQADSNSIWKDKELGEV
jgi:hypothetical protein